MGSTVMDKLLPNKSWRKSRKLLDSVRREIVEYFESAYNAELAADELCNKFLEKGKLLIVGMNFKDAYVNYQLLNENDLKAFNADEVKLIVETEKSPFDDMLLIFYLNKDKTLDFKLVNGMGSRLFEIAKQFSVGPARSQ